jgi:hypothetical protein
MVLKFLEPKGGYTTDAVEALNYAVNNGAKISNNSWGGGGRSQALQDAIAAADSRGHLFVAAAGTGGSDGVGDDNDVTPDYPASYDHPNIISVAATDDADRLVLQLRRPDRRPRCARGEHYEHPAGRRVRLVQWHLDGDAARHGCGGSHQEPPPLIGSCSAKGPDPSVRGQTAQPGR